jgi:hypothetical protein
MGISPFVECICPSCFENIYLGECAIMSGVTSGKVLKPKGGVLSRMTVEPLDGKKYALELAQRACTKCGYLLPSNIESVPSIMLAIVGDTFSGKSHFIASFIHQLKNVWLGNTSGFARMVCLTPDVEKTYTQTYFRPLFVDKKTLRPTQQATKVTTEPLIYALSVSPTTKHLPIRANLMIYDTAGEAFESATRLVQVSRFALNTNALIFVVDPLTIPKIYADLPSPLQTLLQTEFTNAQRRTSVDNISTVLPIFERFRAQGANLSGVPIAVMLSKADLLKPIFPPPNTYSFLTNPTYNDELDLHDIETVDREVRDFLKQYDQGALLAATKQIKDVKFFATSATGKPPDAIGQFVSVDPCRCLDPALWILYRLGIIKGYNN